MTFSFRDGTMDAWIYSQVVAHNEYNLPRSFKATDTIIDIGAHIGSFSLAAYLRGSRDIHAYEAHPDNFEWLSQNLALNEGITTYNYAVWRSDVSENNLRHTGHSTVHSTSGDIQNTGGGNVVWENGEGIPVKSISLDHILTTLDRPIKLLKIDAETSEFPIILTSMLLPSYVLEVRGEFHEVTDPNNIPPQAKTPGYPVWSVDALSVWFQRRGYEFTYMRAMNPDNTESHMGFFRAVK